MYFWFSVSSLAFEPLTFTMSSFLLKFWERWWLLLDLRLCLEEREGHIITGLWSPELKLQPWGCKTHCKGAWQLPRVHWCPSSCFNTWQWPVDSCFKCPQPFLSLYSDISSCWPPAVASGLQVTHDLRTNSWNPYPLINWWIKRCEALASVWGGNSEIQESKIFKAPSQLLKGETMEGDSESSSLPAIGDVPGADFVSVSPELWELS